MMQTSLKYRSIYEELKSQILSDQYAPGDTFPAEPELQKRFDASRVTIRRSVQMLVDDGYLKRIQGVGTIVISNKQTLQLGNLVSFADENKNRATSSIIVESTPVMKAPGLVQSRLGIGTESTVSYQAKIRVGDDGPIGFQRIYVPSSVGLTEKELSDPNSSLYKKLEEKGHAVYTAEETIDAVLCSDIIAEYLHIEKGTPLLYVQRVTQDSTGAAIEYAEIYYRGDRYHYSIQLQTPPIDRQQ